MPLHYKIHAAFTMQVPRRRAGRAEGGLESLLHYQPTHTSVEDNMKEAVHMLDLLSPDQRKGFLRLFSQFVQQRHKPAVDWARLEQPPPRVVVRAGDIPPCPKDQALRHELLDKMVILKLNGERCNQSSEMHDRSPPLVFTIGTRIVFPLKPP